MASPTELKTSRHLRAPRHEVFAAISNPERLARWWGPAGFTNTFEICEFRNGGRWLFTMHGPDGANYPNECTFLDIQAGERVVIRHTCPPLFTLSIQLSEADGITRIDWCQRFDDAATCNALSDVCIPSNEQNLYRLATEVEKQ